jgi:hypothetical protein
MSLVAQIYESAANAGLLKECLWYPSNGAPSQRHQVGFAAPDESVLDGLTLSTDYEMTYPVTALNGLAAREVVEVGGSSFQVRDIRAVGDGSELRAKLTRL